MAGPGHDTDRGSVQLSYDVTATRPPASTSGERGGGVPASPGALGIGTFPDLDRPRLKLESKKASVEFLVVDRAEGPDGKLSTTAQCRRAASDMGGYRDKGSSDVTREPAGRRRSMPLSHYPRAPPQGEPNTTGSSCPILKGGWAVGRTSAVTQTRPTRR